MVSTSREDKPVHAAFRGGERSLGLARTEPVDGERNSLAKLGQRRGRCVQLPVRSQHTEYVCWVECLDRVSIRILAGVASLASVASTRLDWLLVDLDGDGSDELIEHVEEFGHNLSGHESISVMTIEDGVPGTRFTLPLSHRDGYWAREFPATSPCEGTYRFACGDRGVQLLEIVGHPNGEPDNVAQCASAGRHRYTWAGQQLQEIP